MNLLIFPNCACRSYHTVVFEKLTSKTITGCIPQFGEVDDRRKLMAITYNNMSCLFKRKGLLKTALGYAEKVRS